MVVFYDLLCSSESKNETETRKKGAKEMTFREKLQQEHPEKCHPIYEGGVVGCPFMYGYEPQNADTYHNHCVGTNCKQCWGREVSE